MVKTRDRTSKKVDDFADKADTPSLADDPGAPRGKKRGGSDTLVSLNAYETKIIVQAAKESSRSVLGFIRLAAVNAGKEILDK